MRQGRQERIQDKVCWLCRVLLGGLFIYAAWRKLNAPQELADSIASYHLLPGLLINLMALGLPLFELACGIALLTGYLGTIGLLSVSSMLVLFLAALVSALVRGLQIHCGCFGSDSWLDAAPGPTALRDIVLLTCSLYAYQYYLRRDAKILAAESGT